jgi:hypothetical protein
MAIRVGIGIITYNRKEVLLETLARVRALTLLRAVVCRGVRQAFVMPAIAGG